MISSSRLRNSGRKKSLSVSITLSFACPYSASSSLSILNPKLDIRSMCSAPMFEVMMMIVFLKFTLRPLASVRCPESSTWSRMLKTSGCAFSISSRRITAYGRRRIRSVIEPPSSWPTYPGGEPMIFETECFSMNSDISTRTSAS